MRHSRGFTLIEVLVAMMILAGSMLALSQSWSGSLVRYRKTQDLAIITSLLKKKTTELEIKYRELAFGEIPEEDGGDFGSEYPNYTWAVKTKELEFPDIAETLVSQAGGSSDLLLTVVKQMTQYFSKNTKEVQVTLIWKSNKREAKYSISTYITNAAGGALTAPVGP